MAELGCDVTAFDITESGIRKTKRLAAERGVAINAFVADINDFTIEDNSAGILHYHCMDTVIAKRKQ